VRKKQQRKDAFGTLSNAHKGNPNWPGRWREAFADPTLQLWAELGCGKAHFARALALQRPDINLLAIDVKADRLWRGAVEALEEGIHNLRFVQEDIMLAGQMFGPEELDRIWITFPDPYPKASHARRRLTGPYFIEQYKRILRKGGQVHFKTDNVPLFDYTLEVLKELKIEPKDVTYDLHGGAPYPTPEAALHTAYETKFRQQGLTICYLCFAP